LENLKFDENWCAHLQVRLLPEGQLDWRYKAI
jgi:hypothetical protein